MKPLKPLIALVIAALFYLATKTDDNHASHSLKEWRVQGSHFHYHSPNDSYVIFYRDIHNNLPSENKHTLLLLHGFPTSSFDYLKLLPELSKKYQRIIAPDFLGFGFSDKPIAHTYTMKEQSNIVSALLLSLNATSVHVIAHDYGVTVGQELLARQTESRAIKVLSICFLNGGLFPEMHRPRLIQTLLLNGVVGPFISTLSNYNMLIPSFQQVIGPETQYSEPDLLDVWYIISFNNGHKLNHKLINYIPDRKQNRDRWVGALEGETPILLINGPYDPVSGIHMVHYYTEKFMNGTETSKIIPTKLFPQREVVVLGEKVGHYPQWESPQEVLDAYLKWITPAIQ